MSNPDKFQMRIEPEVKEAIEYLEKRGYSVKFKVKVYLIQLAEKDKEQQKINQNMTSSDVLTS